jgi:hypothetical protein
VNPLGTPEDRQPRLQGWPFEASLKEQKNRRKSLGL